MTQNFKSWWTAEKGAVRGAVLDYVRRVDTVQAELFNRFVKLEAAYDGPDRANGSVGIHSSRGLSDGGRMVENVVATNVDTAAAQIGVADIRPTFDTDGADWSEQRKARHREWYAEGLAKMLGVGEKCQHGLKVGAAIKGTALNKVYIDGFDQIRVDQVMPDDIVVDQVECRNSAPRQMHYRVPMCRESLKAQFPGFDSEIDRATSGDRTTTGGRQLWAGYRPIEHNEVMVVESWRLPIGVPGHDRYIPGRHTIVIDTVDLVDEEWNKPQFPFAVMFWEKPTRGWYGIGMVERIIGVQRALNRRNLQIERQLDQGAFPTTYVSQVDRGLASQTTNTIGNIAVVKGERPLTVIPPVVSPETYRDADRLSSKAGEISGVSRLAANAVKPPGIESAVALREYTSATTVRFSTQEKAYEKFYLDTVVLILDCCKDLGDKAPAIVRKSKFGAKKLSWAKVDMNDIRIQIGAASTLSRTRAGREQTVVEWAQAGIITQDDARRLMEHPDLERAMSLYTAAIENVEYCLEEIADGGIVVPEPTMNLKLLVWRATQQYLNWDADGAPEEILENLRQLIDQATWLLTDPSESAGADGSTSSDGSMGPPPMPAGGPPMGPPPQAALASQAMSLTPQ